MKVTIFFHIYYPESVQEVVTLLRSFIPDQTQFIFNVPVHENGVHIRMSEELKSGFPSAVVLNGTNKGKDIGGKLLMLNYYLYNNRKTDYMVFLHDKKSELSYSVNDQKVNAEVWKNELFSIIQNENINEIIDSFNDKSIGMATHYKHIYNMNEHGEYVIFGNNKNYLDELTKMFSLNSIISENTEFAGGTMFWTRSEIFEDFFNQHSPLKIRALLENGSFTDRYTGTYTHAMERIFSWIITSKGYKIKGIQ